MDLLYQEMYTMNPKVCYPAHWAWENQFWSGSEMSGSC